MLGQLGPISPAKIGVSPRDGMDAVLQRLEAVEKKNHQLEALLARVPTPAATSENSTAAPAASAKIGTGTVLGGSRELAEEVVDSLETADAQDIANLYSYSVEVALDTESPVRMVTCFLQLGLLLSIQILYSFGYWDASTLQMGISTLPAFMDDIDLSLLYSTSVLEGSNLTLVNLLCSLCSLALLALVIKNDNEGTLLTTQPLQLLLLGDGDHLLSESERLGRMSSSQEEGRGWMRRIGRVALVLALQSLALCRALLLPLYAALGAAGNFAGSSNAQDIVLNSVAIGFVFELDEWLYEALLNKAKRTSFEEGAPRPMSPLSSRHEGRGTRLVSIWCWACFLLDVAVPTYFYLNVALPVDLVITSSWYNTVIRQYFFWRAGLLTLAPIHVAYRCGGSKLAPRAFARYAVTFTALSLILAAVIFSLSFRLINPNLGVAMEGAVLHPSTFACLMGMDPPQGSLPCSMLHKTPGLYDAMAKKQNEVKPPWYAIELMWGAKPFLDEAALAAQMSAMMRDTG